MRPRTLWWSDGKMRWWVVLCVAVLWDTAFPQPTKGTNNDRECCPCPKDADAASSDTLEAVNPFTAASSAARAATGCPCQQLRSADSEGAPTAFLPAAVRAIRPFVSLDDSKEDPKPLLHPEVDLASSVLDTLREATDQEYREALARDAARAAQESDGIAAESAHNLVFVKPRDEDDLTSEASHVHEARCTNPLGRSSLNLRAKAYDSPDLLSILRLPKRKQPTFRAWNLFDMDSGVGASNINEQVVAPSVKESVLEAPRSNSLDRSSKDSKSNTLNLRVPSLFKNTNGDSVGSILDKLRESSKLPNKLGIPKLITKIDTSFLSRKSSDKDLGLTSNVIDKEDCDSPSTLKLKIPHISKKGSSNLAKNIEQDRLSTTNDNHGENSSPAIKLDIPRISQLIPKVRLANDQIEKDENTGLRHSENNIKLEIPNVKTAVQRNDKPSDDFLASDSMDSASTIKERYSSFAKISTDGSTDLETNKETCNDLKMPSAKSINLKNFDSNVDTSEKPNKFDFKVPDLKFGPTNSRDATTDLVNNILKGLKVPNLRDLISADILNLRKHDLATKSTEQKEVTEVLPNKSFSTEILDTVPSPSEPQTNHVNFVEKERDDDVSNRIDEKIQEQIENMPVKTEILDSLSKSSETNEFENIGNPELDESDDDNNDLINAASAQTQNSFVNGEEASEPVNEIEETNEDSIDNVIDNTNDGIMDRGNSIENTVEDFDSAKSSSDEVGRDDFVSENKIDGLAINSDIQSMNEKSVPEIPSDSDQNVVPPLRDRIRQRLESLNLAPKIAIDFPKLKGLTSTKEQVQSDTITSKQSSESSDENNDQVNIYDLQKMSDSLLDKEKVQKDAVEENIRPKNEPSNLRVSDEIADNNVLELNNKNDVKKGDKECIVNSSFDKNTDSDTLKESKTNEMDIGASERVANVASPDFNLASPLRQSSILEPLSFGSDLNLFNLPGLDLPNLLNNPIPALKIPNLLKPREDNDINLFPNDESDSFEDDFQPSMSAQPSTSNFRSSLAPLQPFEDINLDILQLKPLSADMPTLPRLNLNSFKTRLALPKSLDLKPVLLESSIGNKKGVIGATLTMGKGRKFDPSSLLQEASASLKSSNILRQSLGALPSLDDLHENFWEKTQNLLTTPLEMTGRNAVEDTLRSSQVLTDNFRVHAENAMKDFHQNLASTFKGVGFQSPSRLGSFKSSSNLLDEIASRHEDVNDKLKGISVDLSDRLESLRDSIFDQYRTPSLGSSLLGQSLFPSLGSAIPKQSSTFRTYSKSQNNGKGKFITPASKRKSTSRTPSKSKLKTASSMVVPKAVEMPKSKAAPLESTFLKSLRKEPTFKIPQFLSPDKPALVSSKPEKNIIDFDRPLIKKPRLGQSKIKISFSTTPRPQGMKNKPSFRADSKFRPKPSMKETLPAFSKSSLKDRGPSKLGSFRDSSGFASESIPSRVKAPLRTPTSLKAVSDETDDLSPMPTTARPKFKLSLTKPKSSLGERNHLKSASSIPEQIRSSSENTLRNNDDNMPRIPVLSWPKKIDDEFITKVREALKARLAEIGKKTVKPVAKAKLGRLEPSTEASDDMARSASNMNDVIDPQAMKENTSYTCKMMCTKNT